MAPLQAGFCQVAQAECRRHPDHPGRLPSLPAHSAPRYVCTGESEIEQAQLDRAETFQNVPVSQLDRLFSATPDSRTSPQPSLSL
jgi:hypothetical protein